MLNKDSFPVGFLLGLIAPALFFIGFYAIIYIIVILLNVPAFLPLRSLVLLSIAPNFLLVRQYYNKKKLEHTGQGILVITVVYIVLFFIFIHGRTLGHLPGLQW
jgi:hypothetical protein